MRLSEMHETGRVNSKIYKNEKIVNCNKTNQIRAYNNNNNNNNSTTTTTTTNNNNNNNNNYELLTIQTYQKDTIKVMLQYCAMHQKVRHTLNLK